jgi:hypothetical protein
MFKLDLNRVRANVTKATTADLLERVTVYREGMEPAALDVIENELRLRGVSYEEQSAFGETHDKAVLRGPDGSPVRCRLCHHAAVEMRWGWHRLLGIMPIFPQRYPYCQRHGPDNRGKLLPAPRATGLE